MHFQTLQQSIIISPVGKSSLTNASFRTHLYDLTRLINRMNYIHPKLENIFGQFSTSWDFSSFSSFSHFKLNKLNKSFWLKIYVEPIKFQGNPVLPAFGKLGRSMETRLGVKVPTKSSLSLGQFRILGRFA
jgi:hypothetical protein